MGVKELMNTELARVRSQLRTVRVLIARTYVALMQTTTDEGRRESSELLADLKQTEKEIEAQLDTLVHVWGNWYPGEIAPVIVASVAPSELSTLSMRLPAPRSVGR